MKFPNIDSSKSLACELWTYEGSNGNSKTSVGQESIALSGHPFGDTWLKDRFATFTDLLILNAIETNLSLCR